MKGGEDEMLFSTYQTPTSQPCNRPSPLVGHRLYTPGRILLHRLELYFQPIPVGLRDDREDYDLKQYHHLASTGISGVSKQFKLKSDSGGHTHLLRIRLFQAITTSGRGKRSPVIEKSGIHSANERGTVSPYDERHT